VVGLSIKSIDYFSYGLPIINNIKGDTWNLVQNNKMGINVADNWNTFVSELSFFQKNVQRKNILTYFDCYFTKKVFKKKIDNALKGGLKKRYV
jgi:hypothetical protein